MKSSDEGISVVSSHSSNSSLSESEMPSIIDELISLEPVREVISPGSVVESTNVIDQLCSTSVQRTDVVEGLLQVMRTGLLKHSWRHIYCSLSDRILKCSFRMNDPHPKYFLNFDLISVSVKINTRELYIISHGSSKIFGFTTIVTSSFQVWAKAILHAIESSRGNLLQLSDFTSQVRWWKVGTR